MRIPLLLLGLFCLAWFIAPPVQGAPNPFLRQGNRTEQAVSPPPAGYPGFLKPLMDRAARLQLFIKRKLSGFSAEIKENPFGRSFWLFMLLSLAYGLVHALGPGHGKVFACSYFLNRPGTFRKGLLLGNLTMFFHVFSAACLVLTGYFILKVSGARTVETFGARLETISYGLLAAIGWFLTTKTVVEMVKAKDREAECGLKDTDNRSLVMMAMAVGLVPCPGASIILIFSFSQGLMTAGLLAMICIGLGMGLTTSLFSILTIYARKTVLAAASGKKALFSLAWAGLSLAGALLIALFGSLMLLSRI